MNKGDLKTGMLVETRDGRLGLVMLDVPNNNGESGGNIITGEIWGSLNDYEDNLISNFGKNLSIGKDSD